MAAAKGANAQWLQAPGTSVPGAFFCPFCAQANVAAGSPTPGASIIQCDKNGISAEHQATDATRTAQAAFPQRCSLQKFAKFQPQDLGAVIA
ncbi:hypothetical protein [Acidovorax kalamii]|uniref:hypothetical protein n=1 Tax=Acidovorax kalamii TaxID=2004485 RepID=UPI0010553772|nr:hypothetical protein [Acidovorax kalamii]